MRAAPQGLTMPAISRMGGWRAAAMACIVMFSVFSFVLSLTTLLALIDGAFDRSLAIFLLAALQIFSVVNAIALFNTRSRLDALVTLTVWLGLSLVATTTNWGRLFAITCAEDYARSAFGEDIQKSVEWSGALAERYLLIWNDAKLLETTLTQDKPQDCEGDTPLEPGNAAWSRTATQYIGGRAMRAQGISERLVRAQAEFGRARFEPSAATISALYSEMKGLAADPMLRRIRMQLTERFSVDKPGCLTGKLRTFVMRLASSSDLQHAPAAPVLFNPSTRNTIRMAYGAMAANFAIWSPGLGSPGRGRADRAMFEADGMTGLRTDESQTLRDAIAGSMLLWLLAALPSFLTLLSAWRLSAPCPAEKAPANHGWDGYGPALRLRRR